MPRKNHAASAKRRVARIHSASTRRTIRAPTAKAKGTAHSVYPEYSIGGWIIIAGLRRSGLRPLPSAGTFASVWNGEAKKIMSARKNAARKASTAVAHGAISRRVLRVAWSARLA